MIKILDASLNDIPIIQQIAEETWWPTYSHILSAEQLRFMLDTIYSVNTLTEVMNSGSQRFIVLYDDSVAQGFAAFGIRPNDPTIFKLHKIYIRPGNQGKGFGKALIAEIIRRIGLQHATALDLNVNRFNKAKNFYEGIGFKVIGEEDVPVGPYFMNDYVMRLQL